MAMHRTKLSAEPHAKAEAGRRVKTVIVGRDGLAVNVHDGDDGGALDVRAPEMQKTLTEILLTLQEVLEHIRDIR